MAEVKTCQCDGCFRYQLHLPGGLQWVVVTRTIEAATPDGKAEERKKRVQFCDTCLKRGDRFIFDRGLETQTERNARKAAVAASAALKKANATPTEKRKDADTKPPA